MTVNSIKEADAPLKALPLGQANLLTFETDAHSAPHPAWNAH